MHWGVTSQYFTRKKIILIVLFQPVLLIIKYTINNYARITWCRYPPSTTFFPSSGIIFRLGDNNSSFMQLEKHVLVSSVKHHQAMIECFGDNSYIIKVHQFSMRINYAHNKGAASRNYVIWILLLLLPRIYLYSIVDI